MGKMLPDQREEEERREKERENAVNSAHFVLQGQRKHSARANYLTKFEMSDLKHQSMKMIPPHKARMFRYYSKKGLT